MSSPIKPMTHYVVAVKEKKPEKTARAFFCQNQRKKNQKLLR